MVKIEKAAAGALSEAVFELPSPLRLADTINVLDMEESEGRAIVKSIGTARQSAYDYFGLVVATREPFDDLGKEVPVRASFVMKDGSVGTRVAPVRVFRPLLEFADAPDVLPLAGSGPGGPPVPIRLRFSGFGDITVRARCSVGGRTVSRRMPPLDEILGLLLLDPAPYLGGAEPECPDAEGDGGAAELAAEEVRETLLSDDSIAGMLGSGRIDADGARTLRGLADSGRDVILGRIRKIMPAIVAGSLADAGARALGESIKLESRTAIVAPAELPPGPLVVEFRYADALGNEYDPIQRAIRIDDRRGAAGTGASLEMELAVTADESGAYRNVAEMDIAALA